MNELSPTEIAFINECNKLITEIAQASETFNYAGVHFFGRIGGAGGTIRFSINDRAASGEYDFRTREACITHLQGLAVVARNGGF